MILQFFPPLASTAFHTCIPNEMFLRYPLFILFDFDYDAVMFCAFVLCDVVVFFLLLVFSSLI